MLHSKELQAVLEGFQLNNPDATWEDLKGALRDVAEGLLSRSVPSQHLNGHYDLLEDHLNTLAEITATMPLTVNQAKTLIAAKEIFKAAQRKLQGHPERLAEIVEGLNEGSDVLQLSSLSSSVRASASVSQVKRRPAVSFRSLSESYMAEHSVNIKPTTLVQQTSIHKKLAEAFEACEVMDMSTHTRADLVKIKAHLSETRAVSTVNNFMLVISTVLTWAVDNGLIEHNYSQRLKTVKGAGSSRKGFTVDQVDALLKLAAGRTTEIHMACALGAVTGARLQEVLQLRKVDMLLTPDSITMHINEDAEGKSVKNKGSIRWVPVVSTSKWLDTDVLRAYIEALPTDDSRLFTQKSLPKILNALVKAATGNDKDLVFHSLRHTMSGLLQANEVILQTSAAILGHATGSVTFDTYGGAMGQKTLRDALEKVLPPKVD